jgi:hypothetical protein
MSKILIGGPAAGSSGGGATEVVPPTLLVASNPTGDTIDLTWVDNSGIETGYRVEMSTDNVAWNDFQDTVAEATTHTYTGLIVGILYYFRVSAFSAGTFSDVSSVDSLSTLALNAPTAFASDGYTETTVDLVWVDNSTIETGYRIEMSTDDITWSSFIDVAPDVVSYTYTGLTVDILYYFRVSAIYNSQYSTLSLTVEATPSAAPSYINPFVIGHTRGTTTIVKGYNLDNTIYTSADVGYYFSGIVGDRVTGDYYLEGGTQSQTMIKFDINHNLLLSKTGAINYFNYSFKYVTNTGNPVGESGGIIKCFDGLDMLTTLWTAGSTAEEWNLGGYATDSNDNFYVFNRNDTSLYKYSNTGAQIWKKFFAISNLYNRTPIHVDANDNIYVMYDGSYGLQVYNASGTIIEASVISKSGVGDITKDVNGNIYLATSTTLYKYNSSYTELWNIPYSIVQMEVINGDELLIGTTTNISILDASGTQIYTQATGTTLNGFDIVNAEKY